MGGGKEEVVHDALAVLHRPSTGGVALKRDKLVVGWTDWGGDGGEWVGGSPASATGDP